MIRVSSSLINHIIYISLRINYCVFSNIVHSSDFDRDGGKVSDFESCVGEFRSFVLDQHFVIKECLQERRSMHILQ